MLAHIPRAITQYKLAGTRSFRLSSSKLFDIGLQAQNTDKESLDIFEAPPGTKIMTTGRDGFKHRGRKLLMLQRSDIIATID